MYSEAQREIKYVYISLIYFIIPPGIILIQALLYLYMGMICNWFAKRCTYTYFAPTFSPSVTYTDIHVYDSAYM